jgi:lysophospholipase L1-like esterase
MKRLAPAALIIAVFASLLPWISRASQNKTSAPKPAAVSAAASASAKKPSASKPATVSTAASASKKKQSASKPPATSAAARAKAMAQITRDMEKPWTLHNPEALVPFFELLYRAQNGGAVHVMQFGDSHTASDDWVNSMREPAQKRFGNGGPGFIFAGSPYRGYRRYDAHGSNSKDWQTTGTALLPGDWRNGLGVSIQANSVNETAILTAAGEKTELYYLRTAAGGAATLELDGATIERAVEAGEEGLGIWKRATSPGSHRYVVRTKSQAPVRLLGWTVDNRAGITWETLGINGAQADIINGWNDPLFLALMERRSPALIVLAYGTNEAMSKNFDPAVYRAAFRNAVRKIRRAAPVASILVVGPPDCYFRRGNGWAPYPFLNDVIEIQQQVAAEERCAFWDWRERMGGPGSKKQWVASGLAQDDHVHFTVPGYHMIGKALFTDIFRLYDMFLRIRKEIYEQPREDREGAAGSDQQP